MADNKREMQDIADELVRQGWRVRKGRHFCAYPLDKSKAPVFFSITPSDHRSLINIILKLRRAGADL